jgi:hypothetical protein
MRTQKKGTNLDIVSLVVVATLTEEAMGDHAVDVKFVKDRVRVLYGLHEH